MKVKIRGVIRCKLEILRAKPKGSEGGKVNKMKIKLIQIKEIHTVMRMALIVIPKFITVQYCTVLYCTVLYCIVLYCTVLCCAVRVQCM